MIIAPGSTSQSITVQIVDDAGLAVTGLVAATFPAVKYKKSGAVAEVSITLSDLAAMTTAYSSGGVFESSGGFYRLDLPDAAISTTARVTMIGDAAGKHLIAPLIDVQGITLSDAEMQEIANIVHRGRKVWWASANGSNGNGMRPSTGKTTINGAFALATADQGELVVATAGTYAQSTTPIVQPNGTGFIGAGINATIITGNPELNTTAQGVLFKYGSNTFARDCTILAGLNAGAGAFHAPLGYNEVSPVSQTPGLNFHGENIRAHGNSDAVYCRLASDATVTASSDSFVGCLFDGQWDILTHYNNAGQVTRYVDCVVSGLSTYALQLETRGVLNPRSKVWLYNTPINIHNASTAGLGLESIAGVQTGLDGTTTIARTFLQNSPISMSYTETTAVTANPARAYTGAKIELVDSCFDRQFSNVTTGAGAINVVDDGSVHPTVYGRTLDVSSGGEAGLDWANIGTPGSTVSLSATTVSNVTTTTTATNLTNAPTNGDFTAAMKTSLNAATPAVTVSDKTGFKLASDGLAAVTAWTVNFTGSLSGSVGSVTGAVGSVTGNVGGNVTGSVGSVASGGIISGSFAAGAINSTVAPNLDAAITSRLAPTTAGRTLDVTATGEAGIDWGNIGTQGATVSLTATTVANVTNVSGNISGAVGSVTGDVGGKVLGGGATPLGGNIGVNAAVDASAIANSVFEEAVPGMHAVGTAGYAIADKSIGVGGITSSSFSAGAIDAAAIATSAVDKIVDGILDEDISTHQTPGSVGEAIDAGGSGGGATPAQIWTYASRSLTDGTIRVATPEQVGTQHIVRGTSYLNADGNAKTFTNDGEHVWPSTLLTGGWTVTLRYEPTPATLARVPLAATLSKAGTVVSASVVRFDLLTTETATLTIGANSYTYTVIASKTGLERLLESGTCTVQDDLVTA